MASVISASTTSTTALNVSADTTGVLQLATGATPTTAVTIDTSQNVGIGTSSPVSKLEVAVGTAGGSLNITNTANTNTAKLRVTTSQSSMDFAEDGTGGFIEQLGAYPIRFYTNNTERMRIDSSGNVGIGTSSPSFPLDVRSSNPSLNIQASTGTNQTSLLLQNTGGSFYFGIDNSAGTSYGTGTAYGRSLWSSGAYPMTFVTNSTERMRIDSSGNVLIGSTTAAGKFYSYNTNNSWGAYVECNSVSLTAGVLALVASRNTTNNTYKAIVYYNSGAGADRFYVTDGGAVYGTGAYNQISDGRLKENVRDIDVGLSSILNLQPRIFDWKENKGSNTKNNIGFIAQEVENVLPHAVSDWTNSQGDETVYKAVSMESMIPVLVKSIQEQQTIINDLTARIETLESK